MLTGPSASLIGSLQFEIEETSDSGRCASQTLRGCDRQRSAWKNDREIVQYQRSDSVKALRAVTY